MSYEIGTVLMNIDGEWWSFRGMDSIAWMIRWDEQEDAPYIYQDDGNCIYGELQQQVMFG
jgi:hypothetical protein